MKTPTERNEARSVRAGEGGADLARHDPEEGHGGGLQVGVVQCRALADGVTAVPAGLHQHVEEPAEGEAGRDQPEEQPGPHHHPRPDHPFTPGTRRSVHEPGFGGLAAEGEGREGLRAEVDGEDGHDRERQRDGSAGQRENEERDQFGCEVHEDVEDELPDVGVDAAAFFDGRDDGREVVVGEDHGCRLTGDVRTAAAHGDADVGSAQGRRVIDAVPGHGDDFALVPESVGDAQPRLG